MAGQNSLTHSINQAWAPLRHPFFRAMWIASVASNIGTWMHTVAAGWLMTMLALSPLLVALVQTATTLPVFLIGLPAGAIADLVNRRRLLIFTQSWMLAVAAALGALTLAGAIGPWWLLLLTFALGLGSGMNGPAWAAAIPELVPREELALAVALNSVGFNIARALGPALGGLVMAASNAGVVFLVNAVSFLGVIVVLWRWKYAHEPLNERDAGLHHAMRQGLHYVSSTPAYHAVLVRTGLFAFAGSALWAMLPVVASTEIGTTSLGYGILLGCLGAGSVVGAAILAPLRSRYSPDQLVAAGVLLFGAATMALSLTSRFVPVAVAMLLGGVAWMTVMSTFSVCAQTAPPLWIRARALAVYLLIFQGGMAIGSASFGALASRIGNRDTLLAAAALLVAGLATAPKLSLSPAETDAVAVESVS
ncbi:MAG: MFS transporter [Bryobacteraceae bacterium]